MKDLVKNKLFPYIIPYKTKVFGAFILSFLIAGLGGAQVRLVKPIFDTGLKGYSSVEDVMFLAGLLVAVGLMHFPSRFFHFYWLRYVSDRATLKVREEIFQKLQKLPVSYFAKKKQGELISSILNDTQVFSYGFKAALDVIRESLKAVVYLGMAFWSDWQLTLVIFVIAPFLAVIFSKSGKKVRANQGSVQEEQAQLTHNIAEGIHAQKITKAFNLQEFVNSRFKKAQERFFSAQMRTTFIEEFAHPLVEIVGTFAFAGLIVFAHYRLKNGTTIGDFISFATALALFMDPLRKFSQANVKLSQAKAASDRIFELLETPDEPDSGEVAINSFSEKIIVNDLTFSYGEGDVIKNLNLEINKGEKIALVGLSGSGKSTLINLLLGLYPIARGGISIDGIDLNDIKLKSLRDLFGLVSQDIFLFNDTIKENLLVGSDFTQEQVNKALEVAYANEFVEKLPELTETVVGDRGARLSGGQQQRITIARAFLQDAEILLFDEATSALDNESEKLVQKALDSIGGNKTVVAVAHRLSTIQNFDRIYVLHEGHLVEHGSHEQLISKGGEYAKLYDLSQS
ncbi:putative ABC transport system, ATP-binding protein [Halobacteriovorax marinus SJ]|uniref:ABC transport system, ATP-binding protein n=1 Tax=Halobacteriovorax marinus (strain ATCC BAA-682 / DSM 15412 / SJ) TaxID=862908 RepID=E1WYS4_HALMS|nr:ABC transporter ATP-binding protein [Halobacteriovorax marinus]CBW27714.1 putative ABC transport system, ATP-binding protein [Halobacteriovorax marinus SJ]